MQLQLLEVDVKSILEGLFEMKKFSSIVNSEGGIDIDEDNR